MDNVQNGESCNCCTAKIISYTTLRKRERHRSRRNIEKLLNFQLVSRPIIVKTAFRDQLQFVLF
jgi:hypothetical protein